MNIYNLNDYKEVTSKEFQEYFKNAPKTYPVVFSDLQINFGHCYTYGYCTYDTDKIIGIFKGANCNEQFSKYYILKS